MAKLCLAFCSTIKTPIPRFLTRLRFWKSSLHNRGERPKDGSSSVKIWGEDIIARPIATICCSPPDIVRATWRRRSTSLGNSENMRSRLACSSPFARSGNAPRRRFSSTVRSPKIPRPSGTSAMPSSTICSAGKPFKLCPLSVTAPCTCPSQIPDTAFNSVDFPAPLAPRMTTISPGETCSAVSSSAWCLP